MTDLPHLGGNATIARGIAPTGEVVGQSATGSGETHPVAWRSGLIAGLGTLGGTFASANDVDAWGEVVGYSDTSPTEPHNSHAFLWRAGVMIDLGTLPGHAFSEATGINARGQACGYSRDAFGHSSAVLWTVE
jgi:probable HAF family extracellular repeat protein